MGCLSILWQAVGLLFLISGSLALEWIQRPENASRKEGMDVTFVCRLSSDDPNIVWVKDNGGNTAILFVKAERFEADRRLSVVNKYDLVITNISRADSGLYACRTKGAGSQTAMLTVVLYPGPPKITRDNSGPVYTEGDRVRFTCSSTGGNPKPSIAWLKNGNIISGTPDVREDAVIGGTVNSTITVTMDKSDDRANYSCLLYNELNINNKLMDNMVLSVMYSPSIAFRPYSPAYTVRTGSSAEVVCDVDANPAVNSVIWFKDGIRLAGTSIKRTISSISKANHGNYTCTAKNSIGERSGSLELNVQYAPNIVVQPVVSVNEGEDVTVSCDVDANPAPFEVQWSRVSPGGSLLPVVNSHSLRLFSINKSQAGNYTCRVQSQLRVSGKSAEFVTSQAFMYIHVQYKPGAASVGPVPDLDIGERLDITCTATPTGYPEATYIWSKDGQTLRQNKQMLTIVSVGLSDNGRYNCTPTNLRGSGASALVDVHVYEPPRVINKLLPEVTVNLTDPNLYNLTCVARGYPQPRITWYQEGDTQALNAKADLFTVVMATSASDTYSFRVESTLLFKGPERKKSSQSGKMTALQIRDMGNYSCQAESDKHSDTPASHSRLMINFSPVLEATSKRLAVSRLEKAEMACSAQAHPDPSFLWFFKGQQLTSGHSGAVISQEPLVGAGRMKSRLVLMAVTDQSLGLYRCVARNVFGNISQDILLSMKSPPDSPTNLTSTSMTWESVILTWIPGFDGGHDQRFYIQKRRAAEEVQKIPVTAGSSPSFNVTKLHPSTTYTFQVVAENQIGSSPVSQPLDITTSYLQIPSQPKVPVFNVRHRKLMVTSSPNSNDYCLRVEVKSDRGNWSPVNGCIKVLGDSVEVAHTRVMAINVSVCLSHRPEVCGPPVAAEIHTNEKETTLTEEHVIIIACVCGVIIVSLLIILFCFIFRRRRNAAKAYQGSNQGDPPPYNAVPANKKPQVYDNQDGPLDPYISYSSQPPPSPRKDVSVQPWSTGLQPHSNHTANKSGDQGQIFFKHQYNNGTEGYPHRDAQDTSNVPHSPSKDKYIGLQDRGGGGDPMMGGLEGSYMSGDPSAGASKPKKVIYEVVV